MRYNYKNGKKQGFYKQYYRSGALEMVDRCENGEIIFEE